MISRKTDQPKKTDAEPEAATNGTPFPFLETNIGLAIDTLVEYLADHHIKDIHPLIMGEVERRLIIKALEKSRGNKLQAARILGMNRNTFHKKMQKLEATGCDFFRNRG